MGKSLIRKSLLITIHYMHDQVDKSLHASVKYGGTFHVE